MITLAFEGPETRDGKTPGEAARMLEGAGADIVGANCWQDPTFMLPAIEQMRRVRHDEVNPPGDRFPATPSRSPCIAPPSTRRPPQNRDRAPAPVKTTLTKPLDCR